MPTNSFAIGDLVNDNGTVYYIAPNNVKIPFTSLAAFKGLGYSLNNVVPGDLSNYTLSQPYILSSPTQDHPWSSWLVYKKTVYYYTQDGMLPVSSWDIFLANGGQPKYLIAMNKQDLAQLKSKPALPIVVENDSRVAR